MPLKKERPKGKIKSSNYSSLVKKEEERVRIIEERKSKNFFYDNLYLIKSPIDLGLQIALQC